MSARPVAVLPDPPANPDGQRVVLTKFWTAAGPSPRRASTPTSRNLTMFNPVPAKVPTSRYRCSSRFRTRRGLPGKPAGGWPVAIFSTASRQPHAGPGYGRRASRSLLRGRSIDLPLHGITRRHVEPVLLLAGAIRMLGATERTFNVDLVTTRRARRARTARSTPSGTH